MSVDLGAGGSAELLVSCIMPTRNRRAFVPRAIQYFLRQTYARRELIIVDDGEDGVADLVPEDARIRYVRRREVETVGLKRNFACELARGDLIAHWDDDDWYSPLRIERQVQALADMQCQLVGVSSLLYYDLNSRLAFEYTQPGETSPWLSLLLYRKALWSKYPHPSDRVGSDTAFLRRLPAETCSVMSGRELCVCFVHGQNLAPKRTSHPRWRPVPVHTIEEVLSEDWSLATGEQRIAPPSRFDHTGQHKTTSVQSACVWRVVIFSCERPTHLAALLQDLIREREAGADIDVHVYDDASEQSLAAVESVLRAQGWHLTRSSTRHGKRGFAAWVSRAYAELRAVAPSVMLAFLPDDCRLARGFFDQAWALWQSIEDPNKRTLTVLVDALREHGPCWTGVAPERVGAVWRTQWVDGAFIADRSYLAVLHYGVPPISASWWRRGPQVSSGVGRAISLALHAGGHGMYRTHESLVEHARGPSVMHPWMPHDRLATMRFAEHGGPGTAARKVTAKPASLRTADQPWIVTIMTYERPELLLELLGDLEREAEQHPGLQVHVYDDASSADYRTIVARLATRGWRYVRASMHYGKRGFHQWVSQSWAALRDASPDTLFAFLPDDCRLCSQFFSRAGSLYRELPCDRRGTLNVLVDDSRKSQPVWTRTLPRRLGAVDLTQWVDGAFVADCAFLDALAYRVPAVDESRWTRNARLGSGVGESISRALHSKGFQMYRVAQSLIVHVAAQSQMNAAVRAREPLIAVDFVDGEADHRRLRERVPVIASLASIPQRESQLRLTVQSLLPQVDRLQVYLNGYAQVPSFLLDQRIEVARSQEHGDLGDAGKFFWCEQAHGYQLSCDDDIVYPHDFVRALVAKIEEYQRGAVVGLHGVLLQQPCRSYYRDRTVLHCTRSLPEDRAVHILGTSSCAWHASTLALQRSDFRVPNMADIWLGITCQRQRVPMLALKRQASWLQILPVEDTIYQRYRSNDSIQTSAVAEVVDWRLFAVKPPQRSTYSDEPTVSVLMPVASDRGFLREALASVAAQAGVRIVDLVFINDGCEAINHQSVAGMWSEAATLRYLEQPERRGQSAALNRALPLCRGEFVTVLHDDDLMLERKLQRLCQCLAQQPECGAVYSLPRHIGADGRQIETPLQYETYLAQHPRVCWEDVLREDGLLVHGGTTLYRREALLRVGGWDEKLDTAEEWELNLHLLKQGYSFIACPQVTTGYRVHGHNKSSHFRGRRQAQVAYIRNKHGFPDNKAHGGRAERRV